MKCHCLTAVGALLLPLAASAQRPAPHTQLDVLLKELVEINTSDSAGHTGDAARAMAKHLTDAGFPASDVQVIGETPKYQCLVARVRGKNPALKPILMIAHLDVVDARRDDWSTDPYTLVEKDGWFYGRGTLDDKQGAAILVATLLRMKQDGFVPDRDVIVALAADEETSSNSIKWLIEKNRPLIDAEFALNLDEGAGEVKDGKNVRLTVQTAEKVYITYELEVRNSGGHSSLPVPDNAIYRLSRGLDRLAEFTFPVSLNETTRAFFERAAATQPPAKRRTCATWRRMATPRRRGPSAGGGLRSTRWGKWLDLRDLLQPRRALGARDLRSDDGGMDGRGARGWRAIRRTT
jgi:acetylornithine deacetylase/succinyl-diaminopimelate desuccinylase-like protein